MIVHAKTWNGGRDATKDKAPKTLILYGVPSAVPVKKCKVCGYRCRCNQKLTNWM